MRCLLFLVLLSPTLSAAELPAGKDRDLVAAVCGACHSTQMVAQNRMTRGRWDETLTWMQERQGMPKPDAALRKQLLDYLSTYLAPASQDSIDGLGPRVANPLPPI